MSSAADREGRAAAALAVLVACCGAWPVFAQEAASLADRSAFQIAIERQTESATVSVRDAGARGNGVDDDADAIQRTIDAARPGTVVEFPTGDYLVGKTLVVKNSGVTLRGNGSRLIQRRIGSEPMRFQSLSNGKLFSTEIESPTIAVAGMVDPQYALVAYDGKGVLRLRGGERLRPGDLVMLACPDYGPSVRRQKKSLSYFREQSQLTRLKSLDNGAVAFADPIVLRRPDSGQFRLYAVLPARGVRIEGFKMANPRTGGVFNGIAAAWVENLVVEKVEIAGAARAGIIFYQAYRSAMLGNTVVDAAQTGSGEGYGLGLERSHYCLLRGNTTRMQRHGIVLDHGNANCLVEGNDVYDCSTSASIDIHGEFNSANVVRDNRIARGKTGIVVGGGGAVHYNDGPGNCLVGNRISDCQNGIELSSRTERILLGANEFSGIRGQSLLLNDIDAGQVLTR